MNEQSDFDRKDPDLFGVVNDAYIQIFIKEIMRDNSNLNKLFYKDIWFGLVLWHINHCWLFNTKSCFYIYMKYMICKHILKITQLNDLLVLFQTI